MNHKTARKRYRQHKKQNSTQTIKTTQTIKMKKIPVGRKIRIIGNSNDHNYTIGGVYTITHIDDSDGTLKADDANGNTGNWMRWKDAVPVGTVGWDFIKKVLPADVIEFLGAFNSIENLELSDEVKDAILLSLPDLHERILKKASSLQNLGQTEHPEEVGTDSDDIFG